MPEPTPPRRTLGRTPSVRPAVAPPARAPAQPAAAGSPEEFRRKLQQMARPGTIVDARGRPVVDPPADLSPAAVRAAQEQARADAGDPLAPIAPPAPVGQPTAVPFANLPPARQRDLAAFVGLPVEELSRPADDPAGPAVVNDLGPESFGRPPAAPAPAPAAEAPAGAGATALPGRCSHCGWDAAILDDTVVTPADKQDFVVAVAGGQRFRKRYDALGGALVLGFRGLSSFEEDEAVRQVMADATLDAAGNRTGIPEYYHLSLQGYRLAMSLESVAAAGQAPWDVPELKDFPAEGGRGGLAGLRDAVFAEALPTESVRGIALQAFRRFEDLRSKLVARALDANFYKATGSHS